MGDELNPCPFCGGEARVFEVPDGAIVYCKNFNPTHVIEVASSDEVSAIEEWNRRAIDGKVGDTLNRAAGKYVYVAAENRELRELVICMYQTIKGMKLKAANGDWLPCTDSCPYWGSGDCADLPDDECWYELRMRGLGIEVES